MQSYYVESLVAEAITLDVRGREGLRLEGVGDRQQVWAYVAEQPGFVRLWTRGDIAVYSDSGYTVRIATPPNGGASQAARDADVIRVMTANALAPGWKQRWFGGSIRNLGAAGGYWQPISDGAHWPFGMPTVVTTTIGIEISYDFEAAGIGTVIVSPDETLSVNGWSAGATVEKSMCRIKLGRKKTIADHITWNGTAWTSAGGVFTPTWSTASGGMLVLKHEKIFGQGYSVTPRGYDVEAVIATAGASDPATETRIQLHTRATGAQIATTAEIPANTRVYVSRTDAVPALGGAINPQSAPDQTELPDSNIWILGVHHTGPRPS
ncbi:putative tail fiber protein [Rhodococcus phage E3]|uniref:tail fiber protein n=1 Tax=Rhodococcus phage E3 TaxID=1007869 RepID=UPI0002C69E11|nr:tail fiber protein [Rhodococcus phage E3]AEQ20999.1 putative tail fiber protein [Rhodococcus phage E3]